MLVPTYNAARWLPTSIPSALSQSLGDIELIVSDNASEDDTVAVVESFAREDRRVRLVRQPHNLGLRGNCEALVREARGDYVKLLMADDVLYPGALERLAAALAQPGVVLATARRACIDAAGAVLPDAWFTAPFAPTSRILDGPGMAAVVLELQGNLIGEPSVTMFPRRLVDSSTMFTIGAQRFGTLLDVVAWVRLLANGNLYYDADVLSGFTQHDQQTGRIPANQVLEAVEWAALLRGAADLGVVLPADQWTRALTTYLRRWAALPLEQPEQGLGVIARELAWCSSELARLHDARGAEATAALELYRSRAQAPNEVCSRSAEAAI